MANGMRHGAVTKKMLIIEIPMDSTNSILLSSVYSNDTEPPS